jgi:hypothetical protein
MVKENHQMPTKSKTKRNGSVPETFEIDVLESVKRSNILRICTKTAAQYPSPTPLDEMRVDNCSSGEGPDVFVEPVPADG